MSYAYTGTFAGGVMNYKSMDLHNLNIYADTISQGYIYSRVDEIYADAISQGYMFS